MERKSRLITITAALILVSIISMSVAYFYLQSKLKNSNASQNQTVQSESVSPLLGNLPPTFPRDMPLLQGAEVTSAKETNTDWSAVLLTTKTVDQAKQYYDVQLTSLGWEIGNRSQAAGITIYSVSKKNQDAIISIGKGDRGTTVSITILKSS